MIASVQTRNSKLAKINNKLTVQSQNFANDSCAIRSLDWDRSRFDIEFGLRNGTTYNSFITVSYTHLTLPTTTIV